MTVVQQETDGTPTWGDNFALALQEHRQKLAESLHSERQRIAGAEQDFSASVLQLANELAEAGSSKQREESLLNTILEALDGLRGDVQAGREGEQRETLTLTAELQQARDLLHAQVAELDQAKQEQESLAAACREQLQQLENDRQALTQESAKLAAEEARIHERRKRIARELRARKAEQQAALEQRQVELLRRSMSEDLELAPQLAAATDELAKLHSEVAEREANVEDLVDQTETLNANITRLTIELEAERQAAYGFRERAEGEQQRIQEAREQLEVDLAEVRGTCQTLQGQVDEAEQLAVTFEQAQQAWATEREQLRSESQEQEKLQQELAYFQQLSAESGSEAEALKQQLSQSADEQEDFKARVETLQTQVADLEAERRELQQQSGRMADLQAELEDLKATMDNGDTEVEALSQQLERARAEARQELDDLQTQLAEVRESNDTLQQECKRLRRESAEQAETWSADEVELLQGELEDLRRRFELAVAEVRELKNENVDLQRRADNPTEESSTVSPTPTTGFDWEAQKQMLLNELETGMVGSDSAPASEEEHMTVEGAIHLTDQVVAEKEEMIANLQRQLEAAAVMNSQPAVAEEPDLAEVFDHDEAIQQEREKLQGLQEEWREKLRQAELDVSLERAKLARERLAMEEQLQRWETEKQRLAVSDGTIGDGKRNTGRWLSRLGLSKDDD